MPTITEKPEWGDRRGHAGMLPFSEKQIEELSEIIGQSPDNLRGGLNDVSLAVWMFRTTQPIPVPKISAALTEVVEPADQLFQRLNALDQDSKRVLLAMYHEDGLRTNPRQELKADLASLQRLWSNLMAANKVLRSKNCQRQAQIKDLVGHRVGRPSHDVARFTARCLIDLYEKQVGPFLYSRRKGKSAPRRFVLTAMQMLKIDEKSAPGAIEAVLAQRRDIPISETVEKPPAADG